MTAARRPLPRKVPVQARSRATVERILEAAARVLIADGYGAASTNRIAAEAGVSPGSIYQYFPNKEAIVLAAIEGLTDEMAEQLVETMQAPELATGDPRAAVDTVLSVLLDTMERRRELVRVVAEELPRLGGSSALAAFEQRVRDLVTGYLTGITQGVNRQQTAASVWIAVQCVEQLCVRYVLDRPPIPRDRFITELRRLITRYTAGSLRD